ncbi:hypothetical protein UB51_23460 [Paenibacillus sp. IHBB 10380]|nr:hypothetical protein UB51_23460 [Paenibacillus sp. IHBB 10380]
MDSEVELSWCKDAVKYPLQLHAVDAGQFVAGDDLDIRQKVCGIVRRIGDTGFYFSARNANLVN